MAYTSRIGDRASQLRAARLVGGGMNLNLLPNLLALLEHRSVTRAARSVGVSQSAMSHALAQLRQALGDPLLVRAGGEMLLTPRAERLLGQLRGPLAEIHSALGGSERFDPARDRAVFRVAMSDRYAQLILPRVVRLGGAGVSVDVTPDRISSMRDRLAKGEVGLWITSTLGEEDEEGLRVRHLFEERWVVLFGSGAPRADAEQLSGYLEASHVGLAPARVDRVDAALDAAGYARNVRIRVPYFLSAVQLVGSTPLWFTTPRCALSQLALHPGLQVAEVPFRIPVVRTCLVWHERYNRDARLVWLRDALVESFRAEGPQGAEDSAGQARETS